MDWIKVAAGSAHVSNDVAAAPEQTFTSAGPGDVGLTLGQRASIGWHDLDFDNGRLSVLMTAQTTSSVTLELRVGGSDGQVVDRYELPDTQGQWLDLERAASQEELLGRHDVYLVQTAGEPLALKTVRWSEGVAPYPARRGVDRLATVSGPPARESGDILVIAADSTTALRPVTFKSGAAALAITYSAHRNCHVELRSDDPSSTIIASGTLPETPGDERRSVELLLPPTLTREQMILLRSDSSFSLTTVQPDPVLSNPPRLELSGPADIALGKPTEWRVVSSDPDGNQVSLKATALPHGAAYDPATRTVRWNPERLGTGTFVLVADDGSQLTTIARTIVVHR